MPSTSLDTASPASSAAPLTDAGHHLEPISLGGATTVANLWPEKWDGPDGAYVKDRLELRLLDLVCQGKLPLTQAQHAITTDWVAAYRSYLGPIS